MNPDPVAQAYINMQLAVAIGKGVQLDAEQTAAILALIDAQDERLADLQVEIDMLRQANADCAFESDLCADNGEEP
jgi:hypothetical protein